MSCSALSEAGANRLAHDRFADAAIVERAVEHGSVEHEFLPKCSRGGDRDAAERDRLRLLRPG